MQSVLKKGGFKKIDDEIDYYFGNLILFPPITESLRATIIYSVQSSLKSDTVWVTLYIVCLNLIFVIIIIPSIGY